MHQETLKALLLAVAQSVISHADELTVLDQAIGDGDHGLNMKRGFEAVLAQASEIARHPLPDALNEVGKTLVMTVGGASGPLYGTFFMTFGKSLPSEPTLVELASAFEAAVGAVERRGKSCAGQKTLLDVLVPVGEELQAGPDDLLERVERRALAAADATIPMRATRGRASFLGERSIGHMDPGARSCALIIVSSCELFGN